MRRDGEIARRSKSKTLLLLLLVVVVVVVVTKVVISSACVRVAALARVYQHKYHVWGGGDDEQGRTPYVNMYAHPIPPLGCSVAGIFFSSCV